MGSEMCIRDSFSPLKWGDAFTEGNSWHYTWSVFHDPQGLIDLMGGRKEFITMLDSVFAVPPVFDDSYYGQVIHEIREMQIMNMGNYAHGNQPIQHMIYLYNYAGEPWKAQYWLRQVMDRMYPAPTPPSAESQQAFLDAQKSREGVVETPSGLLFEVITEGEGTPPGLNDTARVTYTGALADGTVFDSTEKPIDLPVSGVVKGFSEGLQMMKPGGTYRLFIPASLGYGDKGAGGVIPPGAALDFTVTLLDVVK